MSKLTDVEQKIVVAMYDGDHEFYYSYSYFEAEAGLDRDVLRPAMKHLRELRIMDFARGLMNDEGEVCGSGFGIGDHDSFYDAYRSVSKEYLSENAFRKEAVELVRELGVDYHQRYQAAKKVMDFVARHRGDALVTATESSDPPQRPGPVKSSHKEQK